MNDEKMIEPTIPIREISRLTGVNSVTLRAWERRYGLIKPLRTHKGHRLYRQDDIELIKKIQAWLVRGLAIGKVSELLNSNQFSYELSVENIWQTYSEELLVLMSELNLGKLDAWFNQIFSVYPADIIADQLITPVLRILSEDAFGNTIKKTILVNRLSEYLFMLTHRQRQEVKRKRLAIVQLTADVNPLLNILLHYGLTASQFKSELIGLTNANEIVFAVKQLELDALIVYNNCCSSLSDYQKELYHLTQKLTLPIIVGGQLAPAIDFASPSQLNILRIGGHQALISVVNEFFSVGFGSAEVLL